MHNNSKDSADQLLDINKPMLVIDRIGYPVLSFNGKSINGRSTPQEKTAMLDAIQEAGPAVFPKMMEKLNNEQKAMLLDHLKKSYDSLSKESGTLVNNILKGPAPVSFANQLAQLIGLFFIFMDTKTAKDIDEVIQKALYQKANCLDLVTEIIRYLEKGCVVDFTIKIHQ